MKEINEFEAIKATFELTQELNNKKTLIEGVIHEEITLKDRIILVAKYLPIAVRILTGALFETELEIENMPLIAKDIEIKIARKSSNNLNYYLEEFLENISPKTWGKTSDCFLDTFEAFPDEIRLWEERNLKFVAYLVLATELLGFFYYFTKTAISSAIANRRISS